MRDIHSLDFPSSLGFLWLLCRILFNSLQYYLVLHLLIEEVNFAIVIEAPLYHSTHRWFISDHAPSLFDLYILLSPIIRLSLVFVFPP
jgi:hypothetical protein